ncbi:MAG: phytase [Hyphomonas sp.]
MSRSAAATGKNAWAVSLPPEAAGRAPLFPAASVIQTSQSLILGTNKQEGLVVFPGALPGYPRGILVVQDDGNPKPEQDQNFKLVDWSSVETALGLPVLVAE